MRNGEKQEMKKKKLNEIKLTLPAHSANESLARSVISFFVSPLDPSVEELADIRCAVSEAVTNCIVHAYKGRQDGKIYINARYYDDATVRIEIIDKGVGIPDVDEAMKPLFTTGGEERSGMGFSIMKSFTDKLKVTSDSSHGTRVVMTKKIG